MKEAAPFCEQKGAQKNFDSFLAMPATPAPPQLINVFAPLFSKSGLFLNCIFSSLDYPARKRE